MIDTLLKLLAGWYRITVLPESRVDALNLLHNERLHVRDVRRGDDGSVSFRISLGESSRFFRLCADQEIQIRRGKLRGVPNLLHRYRGRWGIFIGILLFACIVKMSVSVVWSIEVTGEETITEDEVLALLRECGFTEGVRFTDMDFDLFQNEVLMKTDALSWIAVNMRGTTACVEVRETKTGDSSSRAGAANIIAAEDGQILSVHAESGKPAVAVHDVVRKGDLLIGGIMTIQGEKLRYEYAAGKVIAQVNRTITAEIPLSGEVKTYTGEQSTRKSIIFFEKEIKIFQNAGIEIPTYDTIIESTRLTLPGGIPLPVRIITETHRAYRMESVTIGEKEAYAQAKSRFYSALKELLREAEILSLESHAEMENGVCRITGTAVCAIDIAQTAEISLSD